MTLTLDRSTSDRPPPREPVDDGTRREFLAGSGGLLVIGLAGCGSRDEARSRGATRMVQTDQGRVRVPADPRRIVVTSGVLAGYLFALDAPVRATDTRVLGSRVDAAGFPSLWSVQAQEQGTETLPGGDTLDIEAVAAADPDLIIGGGQGLPGALAESAYEQLSRIAPTVLVSRRLTSWQDELAVIAEILGAEERAAELTREYERRVDEVRAAITLPPQPTAVIYESGQKPFVVFESAILPRVLDEVGFRMDRVAAKAGDPEPYTPGGDAFEISLERLGDVVDAPTLVVVALAGVTSRQLAARPIYAQLPAFRGDRVYDLPPLSYRPDYLAVMDTLDRIEEMLA